MKEIDKLGDQKKKYTENAFTVDEQIETIEETPEQLLQEQPEAIEETEPIERQEAVEQPEEAPLDIEAIVESVQAPKEETNLSLEKMFETQSANNQVSKESLTNELEEHLSNLNNNEN